MSEKPTTVSLGAAVLIALGAVVAVLLFVWQHRRYAKLKAQQEIKEQEAKNLKVRAELEKNEETRKELKAKAEATEKKAAELKTNIERRKAERDEYFKSLDQVTSWDDLIIE